MITAAILLVGTPISIYFSVKFGTYAFYRGKQLFEEHQKTKTGQSPTT